MRDTILCKRKNGTIYWVNGFTHVLGISQYQWTRRGKTLLICPPLRNAARCCKGAVSQQSVVTAYCLLLTVSAHSSMVSSHTPKTDYGLRFNLLSLQVSGTTGWHGIRWVGWDAGSALTLSLSHSLNIATSRAPYDASDASDSSDATTKEHFLSRIQE